MSSHYLKVFISNGHFKMRIFTAQIWPRKIIIFRNFRWINLCTILYFVFAVNVMVQMYLLHITK